MLILYPNFHFLVKFHFYNFQSDVTDRTQLRIEQLILQIRFNAKQFTAMKKKKKENKKKKNERKEKKKEKRDIEGRLEDGKK